MFLSAFLLFQVQPVIAKLILPLFGGGAAVWSACLLFFQTFLLFGYIYAHLLTRFLDPKKQLLAHCSLLALSLILMPIGHIDYNQISVADQPLKAILEILTLNIGLPYFLLSATGPLVQRWFSYSNADKSPYRLYSLSNVGSLIALISYPFLIEPALTMDHQMMVWSIAYGALVAGFIILATKLFNHHDFDSGENSSELSIKGVGGLVWLWMLLACVGVMLLVSTTNAITQNIPPMPFLWILPLCIYLLTFIICFHNARWYVRWYWFAIFAISAMASVLMFFIGTQFDITSQIGMYSLILLSACMICHGELARLKPQVEHLTLYYMFISLGGALGSLLVSYAAPILFNHFYEFVLAILMVFVLFNICLAKDKTEQSQTTINTILKVGSVLSLSIVAVMFYVLDGLYSQYDVDNSRNFYGVLAVKDVTINDEPQRRLIDGTTSHGTQSLVVEKAMEPLSYYRQNTGGALALQHFSPAKPVKAGFIGLGAGALAAYGRKGDDYHFYELNPDVYRMAKSHFSFLSDSKANIEVTLGDGRVNLRHALQKQGENQFDLLVLDAFSGDSIPSHLLTREAFALYWQLLKQDGVLAIHISNSHLDLTPLVRGLSKEIDVQARFYNYKASKGESHDALWVLVSNNLRFNQNPIVKSYQTPWPQNSEQSIVWTDNYSNLLSVLKW